MRALLIGFVVFLAPSLLLGEHTQAPKPPQAPGLVIDYCDCARRGWCDCPFEVCTCQGCKVGNPWRWDAQTKKWWRWGRGTVNSQGWVVPSSAPVITTPTFSSPRQPLFFSTPPMMRGGRGGGC